MKYTYYHFIVLNIFCAVYSNNYDYNAVRLVNPTKVHSKANITFIQEDCKDKLEINLYPEKFLFIKLGDCDIKSITFLKNNTHNTMRNFLNETTFEPISSVCAIETVKNTDNIYYWI